MRFDVRRLPATLFGYGRTSGGWLARAAERIRRRVAVRRTVRIVALLAATWVGLTAGLLLAGPSQGEVGPFTAQYSLTPSWSGGTEVQVPPLGSMQFASHRGPLHLTVRLDSLDQTRTLALASNPNGLAEASQNVLGDVRSGLIRLVVRDAVAALLGVLVVAGFVFRTWRRVAVCAGLGVLTLAASGGLVAATFRPASVEEPTYRGLLANAPAVIGDAQQISEQFGKYRDQLQRLVDNMNKLYGALSTLPVYQPTPGSLRVLHVSDLHLNPVAWPLIATIVRQYDIDMVIDTGDINDWGSPQESAYVDSISDLGIPYVYIRGNHDSEVTATAVARQPNAVVLENRIVTINGLNIAGIGDPRFTPDKQPNGPPGTPAQQAGDAVQASGRTLAATITAAGVPVDIALVHDPAAAAALDGTVPLILAGHRHARDVTLMPRKPGAPATRLMIEGSTGGAGLRGLEHEKPTPLEMSILYFGPQRVLRAYDEITRRRHRPDPGHHPTPGHQHRPRTTTTLAPAIGSTVHIELTPLTHRLSGSSARRR